MCSNKSKSTVELSFLTFDGAKIVIKKLTNFPFVSSSVFSQKFVK